MIRHALMGWLAAVIFLAASVKDVRGEEYVTEPPRRTKVIDDDHDVVVIGGGLSGFGAAVGAARSGARTLIIERTGFLGGWYRGTWLGGMLGVSPGWRPSLREGVLPEIVRGFAAVVEAWGERGWGVRAILTSGELDAFLSDLLVEAERAGANYRDVLDRPPTPRYGR